MSEVPAPSTPMSTIPIARAWLVAQLAAATEGQSIPEVGSEGGRGVVVVDGFTSTNSAANDVITIAAARRTREPLVMMGRIAPGSQLEKVTIEAAITAYGMGSESCDQLTFRAYAWLGLLENIVDSDPFLGMGGDSIIRASCEESDFTPKVDDQGGSVTINAHITYQAQI